MEAEEDDDFGDFGGFEVAEPPLPNVAHVDTSGVEASPSPWAVFPASTSPGNVKPDLLCGQNRFPPVLDPPSAAADVVQNTTNNNSNQEDLVAMGNLGSAEEHNMFDDATLANDILDGSFKSSSSQHSGTASDLIQSSAEASQAIPIDTVPVDLVENLHGASQGLLVVEDEGLPPDGFEQITASNKGNNCDENKVDIVEQCSPVKVDPGSGHGALGQGPQKVDVVEQGGPVKLDLGLSGTLHGQGPLSPSGSSHSSESFHTGGPLMIDSLRKAMQPKSSVDMIRLTSRQSEPSSGTKADGPHKNDVATGHIDPIILEELRQSRVDSQAAIATIVEQYKELSKQCISKQEDVLRECKQTLKQEQEKHTQELLQKQREEFAKALEDEKVIMRKEATNLLQQLVAEQKEEFERQLEEEKSVYEKKLQEALEEEREACRKKLEESLEAEKQKLNKKQEEERSKMREEMNEERKKYIEETKAALSEEKDKNKETMRELLEQEKNHCRDCLKSAIHDIKADMQNHIAQQKQKDQVVRHRQLSSLDVFLETAKQQLNVLMESNHSDVNSSVLEDEKDAT